MVERTLGFLLERSRVRKAPALELNGVDAEHPALGAAPQRRKNPHPGLAERKAQPSGSVFRLEKPVLIRTLPLPFPRGRGGFGGGFVGDVCGWIRKRDALVLHGFLSNAGRR